MRGSASHAALRLARACAVAVVIATLPSRAARADELRIEVAGLAPAPVTLTAADLAALPQAEVKAKSKDGKEETFTGVKLCDLLAKAGVPQGKGLRGAWLARGVLVVASDGYRALFSIPELAKNEAILAWKKDGAAMAPPEGPLRVVAPQDETHARSVRMVVRIVVLAPAEPPP
jgi:DMSO/TMAO reductase YedYZ molybdopterin-dependent catalytic subunit